MQFFITSLSRRCVIMHRRIAKTMVETRTKTEKRHPAMISPSRILRQLGLHISEGKSELPYSTFLGKAFVHHYHFRWRWTPHIPQLSRILVQLYRIQKQSNQNIANISFCLQEMRNLLTVQHKICKFEQYLLTFCKQIL